jgi:hypothetical protein
MKKRKLTPFGLKVKNKLADLNRSQKNWLKNRVPSDDYLVCSYMGNGSGECI